MWYEDELPLPSLDVIRSILQLLCYVDLRVLPAHRCKVSEVDVWDDVVGLANSIDETITGLHIADDFVGSMGFRFLHSFFSK